MREKRNLFSQNSVNKCRRKEENNHQTPHSNIWWRRHLLMCAKISGQKLEQEKLKNKH